MARPFEVLGRNAQEGQIKRYAATQHFARGASTFGAPMRFQLRTDAICRSSRSGDAKGLRRRARFQVSGVNPTP